MSAYAMTALCRILYLVVLLSFFFFLCAEQKSKYAHAMQCNGYDIGCCLLFNAKK